MKPLKRVQTVRYMDQIMEYFFHCSGCFKFLNSLEFGILYLEIIHSSNWSPSFVESAIIILLSWRLFLRYLSILGSMDMLKYNHNHDRESRILFCNIYLMFSLKLSLKCLLVDYVITGRSLNSSFIFHSQFFPRKHATNISNLCHSLNMKICQ